MKQLLEKLYNEERATAIDELEATDYAAYGYESAEDLLNNVETSDCKEGAIRYQGFLSGIKEAQKTRQYDNGLLCEIAYMVGTEGFLEIDVGYDRMMEGYKAIYDKANENKMGRLLQNIYDLFDQGEAKGILLAAIAD